jgi:CheY-like chemotaxis protein
MNAILGYAQLLQQSQLDREQLRKLKIIDDSGNHLLSLINNILELSKIEVGLLELCNSDFDLLELVRNIENMFKIRCDQKKITWQVKFFTKETVLVHGDQGKLRQILINLVGNACKFTDYGEVIFHIKHIAKDRYQFIIKDTGMGIEEDALLRIFDAFHQEKQGEIKGGTGLGLNITRRYIELLSGELHVESRLNQGSSFYFDIELPPAHLSLQTPSEPSDSLFILPENSHLSALVVDDIKDNTDLLSNILKQMGFSTRVAENGQDALDEIARICPDIVFMDIRMPVMDGVDAIVKLRKNYPSKQLKCIAVSATGLKHNAQYYLDKGFDQFVSKPFRFEVIYHAISETLGIQLQAVDNNHLLEKQDKDITYQSSPKYKPHYEKQWIKKIIHAAEYGQLTELRTLILGFNDYDEAGQIVANHLDLLITKADLDAIIDYMEIIIND